MPVKLVYSAPVAVSDSFDEPVTDSTILTALADISCLEGTVLDNLNDIPDLAEFRGGYLRLALDGKRLRVQIEIDSRRKLTKTELATMREDLDGQVSDGIGESGFDFIAEDTEVSVQTFPETGGKKSTLIQTTGEAWQPGKKSVEAAANRRRCRAAATALKAMERAAEKKKGKLDLKKLFKSIQAGDKKGITAEIEELGGDLGFIESGKLPYELLHDRPLLRLLLDAGLNPNLHDREGHSLLWLAAGKADCLELLFARGADVNLCNADVSKETALMRSAWLGNTKGVKFLLEHGADPRLKTFFDDTALDEAQKGYMGNSAETIKLLKAALKKD